MKLALVLIALALASPSRVEAARKKPVLSTAERALSLVAKARFSEAIPLLQDALTDAGADAATIHIGLAKCFFYTKKKDRAVLEIEVALETAPALTLDASATPPDFMALFAEVKERTIAPVVPEEKPNPQPTQAPKPLANESASQRSSEAQPAQSVANTQSITAAPHEAPRPAERPRLSEDAAVYRPAAAYVRWLPLGIGQFLNGDPLGGGVFLSLELALIGANLAFTILNLRARSPSGVFPAGSQWPVFYALQQATAAAAIVTAVMGLLDAYLWSPARGEARFSKRLAVSVFPLSDGMTASVGATF